MSNLKDRLGGKVQALGESAETALTTAESNYVALTTNAMEIISENLKSQPLNHQLFDVIKSPSGGSIAFTVPSLSGDEVEKELVGIILNYNTPRAYWDTPDPVEGTPPVCFSKNSIVSSEGDRCSICRFNDYGSKDGESNAKACKEFVEIFLLRPDSIMPVIVRVPVSSKLIFQRFMTRLISKMIPTYGVVTKITLTKAVSRAGQPFATFCFEVVNHLSPEETAQAKLYGQGFKAVMQAEELAQPLPRAEQGAA
jgi:hypothetical protein